MKLQLWMVNSFLALMFCFAFIVSIWLSRKPPVIKLKPISVERIEREVELKPVPVVGWEKIYKNDVFGTYEIPEVKTVKKSFITPIPEPQPPSVTPIPEPRQLAFVAPLNITLKGIIVTADEQKSAVMFADETNKERMYYLGDKIKDAHIIKIARNRIVLVRANGQQETFYLLKDDPSIPVPDKWEDIVKKVNEQTYKVDPHAFKDEVETLGNFIERAGVLGVAYTQDKPVGIRIGDVGDKDVANALGLLQNDIITSINQISVADAKNRMDLYDAISMMKLGDTISVKLLRSGKEVSIDYKLDKFPRVSRIFAQAVPVTPGVVGTPGAVGIPGKEPLPMSPLQQREQQLREFHARHNGQARDQRTVSEMRSRLLDNLREKLRQARNRTRR